MSDHTSAMLFGEMFKLFAKEPSADHKGLALKLWDLMLTVGCDFAPYQMGADKALIALGLARHKEGCLFYGPTGKETL
jgi:hypothetical protein